MTNTSTEQHGYEPAIRRFLERTNQILDKLHA